MPNDHYGKQGKQTLFPNEGPVSPALELAKFASFSLGAYVVSTKLLFPCFPLFPCPGKQGPAEGVGLFPRMVYSPGHADVHHRETDPRKPI